MLFFFFFFGSAYIDVLFRILRDGTYTLAISPHTKNIDTTPRTVSYLLYNALFYGDLYFQSDDTLAKLSYIRFRTRLSSTVFTQDEVLSSLFENATTSTFSIVTYVCNSLRYSFIFIYYFFKI
jgi:hypothetical protein